jgi:hypothetical protein
VRHQQSLKEVYRLVSFPPISHLFLLDSPLLLYSPHMAGTGNDLISAINLKAEYETLLGLPFGAPYEKIYPAGSEENQRMVRGLGEREDVAVWVDEVCTLSTGKDHREDRKRLNRWRFR